MSEKLSAAQARRIALAAQGFGRGPARGARTQRMSATSRGGWA